MTTDAAIAQAFREYDEGDIVQMRTILARARELDAEKGGDKEDGPGSNTGHGHVWPRPDGGKARCGGPGLCAPCSADAARYPATPPAQAAEAVEAECWRMSKGWLSDATRQRVEANARAAIAAMQAGE